MSGAELEQLVARFRARTLPAAAWTHIEHLGVAAWHIDRFGPSEALVRLREGIRRLNDAHGTPNSDERGYHETITVSFVRLIASALGGARGPLHDKVTALTAGPLGNKNALLTYYSRERLMSVPARRGWVEPDLEALPGATVL